MYTFDKKQKPFFFCTRVKFDLMFLIKMKMMIFRVELNLHYLVLKTNAYKLVNLIN